jgi:hypothetical protein
VDLDAGVRAGLPQAEPVPLRVQGDDHRAHRPDLHRLDDDGAAAARMRSQVAAASLAAKYVVQEGESPGLVSGPDRRPGARP